VTEVHRPWEGGLRSPLPAILGEHYAWPTARSEKGGVPLRNQSSEGEGENISRANKQRGETRRSAEMQGGWWTPNWLLWILQGLLLVTPPPPPTHLHPWSQRPL